MVSKKKHVTATLPNYHGVNNNNVCISYLARYRVKMKAEHLVYFFLQKLGLVTMAAGK